MEEKNSMNAEQENTALENAAQENVDENRVDPESTAQESAGEDRVNPETTVQESAYPEAEIIKNAAQGGAQKPKKDWKKEARDWVMSIAAGLLIVFVIRTFLFQIIRVDGDSMYDTLLNNERLFVSVLDVRLGDVERGDVVICHYPNRGSTNFVKRAVAVPGDTVYRENCVTHVVYETIDENGETVVVDEMLDEGFYKKPLLNTLDEDYAPYTLGENEYFVVGDNRYNSHDSRDWNDNHSANDVGPITGDMLVGRVRAVIFPFSDIRCVE